MQATPTFSILRNIENVGVAWGRGYNMSYGKFILFEIDNNILLLSKFHSKK